MGLISGLMGHAAKMGDLSTVQREFAPFLVEGETVEAAFKLVRDMYVFTSKRAIFVNRQGVTGKKTEYLSIPYSKISCFAKESAGVIDLDAELKIWIAGRHEPVVRQFKGDDCVNEIYAILSQATLV